MPKQYISDVITNDEIAKWQNGNRILIHSQTGSGKSFFIKENLYNYCKPIGKRILLLSNRNLLKNQNIVDIEGKTDIIDAKNYQTFESIISKGEKTLEDLISSYDYIVGDESHYEFSDAPFNDFTSIFLPIIKDTPKNKICIFITATPQALLEYQDNYDFRYNMNFDYSYIKDIYFYNKYTNKSLIVQSIINNISKEEKILYFANSTKNNWELCNQIDGSKFICSPTNKYSNKSDLETISQIVHESKFESRVLFSTKILDNGINLIDKNLKHIIIDMADPISFIQSIGRKRCLSEDDQITLYVRNYNRGNILCLSGTLEDKINIVKDLNDLTSEDNSRKYLKKNMSNIINMKYSINTAMFYHCATQTKLMKDILNMGGNDCYKKYICKLLNFNFNNIKDGNSAFEELSLKYLLEEYLEIKIFTNNQEIFKHRLFDNIFTPKRTDYSARGIEAANRVIDEDKLNFMICSKREGKGKYRGKYYWIVERK